jgi:hypothetical protein
MTSGCFQRELQKRAHSLWLATGLASESENGTLPYSRKFPAACCREVQFSVSSTDDPSQYAGLPQQFDETYHVG